MGAPKEVLDELRSHAAKDEFEVFEENWEAILMFMRLQTQFRIESGAFMGLNFQSIEFLFKLYEIEKPRELFEKLLVMEHEALTVLNQKGT